VFVFFFVGETSLYTLCIRGLLKSLHWNSKSVGFSAGVVALACQKKMRRVFIYIFSFFFEVYSGLTFHCSLTFSLAFLSPISFGHKPHACTNYPNLHIS